MTKNELKRLARRCSRLWRLNNLYTITDRHGRRVTFAMNSAQEAFYHAMHRQNVILKARQRGFTTFIQLIMLDACLFHDDVRAGNHRPHPAQRPGDFSRQGAVSLRPPARRASKTRCRRRATMPASCCWPTIPRSGSGCRCARARCNICTSRNTARSARNTPRRRARCEAARSTPWTRTALCSSRAPRKVRTGISSSCARRRAAGATPATGSPRWTSGFTSRPGTRKPPTRCRRPASRWPRRIAIISPGWSGSASLSTRSSRPGTCARPSSSRAT